MHMQMTHDTDMRRHNHDGASDGDSEDANELGMRGDINKVAIPRELALARYEIDGVVSEV